MADVEKMDAHRPEHIDEINTMKASQALDTVHNDEALKVLATYAGDETWIEEEENKLRRRVDWKLMPILCLTYGLQYYDKAMLGQAVNLLAQSIATFEN